MPPHNSHRYRPLVLIIDDSSHSRKSLRFYLTNEGYDVVEASSGQTAFESATSNSPDLVLIDFNLPGPSGVLSTQRLRSLAQMAGVPIVACAGPDSQAYRDAARAAECDGYVTKPINPAVMMGVVKSLLERRTVGVIPFSDLRQLVNTMP